MTVQVIPADRPIRLALIGCGRISKNHFEAIAKVHDLELVAVCDGVAEVHEVLLLGSGATRQGTGLGRLHGARKEQRASRLGRIPTRSIVI